MSLMSDLLFDPSFSVNLRQNTRFRLQLLDKKDLSMSLQVDHMEENNNAGSDSDSNSVDDAQDYYEPISAVDLDNRNDDEDTYLPIGGQGFSNGLCNGHCMLPEAEEGILSITINGDAELVNESEEDTETESEIRRAFEEDERRRRSPLMEENAARVMEAMRAISFPGTAPDWASDVNEDRWIDQLRRLRSTSQ